MSDISENLLRGLTGLIPDAELPSATFLLLSEFADMVSVLSY